jgi:hypothetical protein
MDKLIPDYPNLINEFPFNLQKKNEIKSNKSITKELKKE